MMRHTSLWPILSFFIISVPCALCFLLVRDASESTELFNRKHQAEALKVKIRLVNVL